MDEHDGRNIVAVVAICLCASWLDKSSSSSSSVPAAALAAQERCRCCRLSMRQLVGQVIVITVRPCASWVPKLSLSPSVRAPAGWPSCRPRLSCGSSLPSSSPSVLVATQVIVVVCPVAHRHRLLHHCCITIAIAVYPCTSYPSRHHHHCHLSRGSSLASARGSGRHHSLPLWLVVIIIVAMVGGDSWDWCWRWWHWLVSGSVCAFVMAGSPSS